ncbi:MAG TPA: high-potential iron-sulfur protein [Gammaproteobacteria bacterium]|nr:high-potential iron-sulfur protein [Gammaproteobacteria bacterium]
MSDSKLTRRGFLRYTVLSAAAVPAAAALVNRPAQAAEKVKPSDPQAKSLKYTEDASTTDAPQHKAGQHCAKCQFFQGSASDKYAPCTIFGGREVNSKGWCTSFAPKA